MIVCIVDRKKNKHMPIPTPQPTETKEQFIERCMSDEKMVAEYDAPQRYAVCSLQLKERK